MWDNNCANSANKGVWGKKNNNGLILAIKLVPLRLFNVRVSKCCYGPSLKTTAAAMLISVVFASLVIVLYSLRYVL